MDIDDRRPVVAFIPPACCGAGYFRRLRRALGGRIDFRSTELPGRGRRYGESRVTEAAVAARDIAEQIDGPVDAVYGESLGAYIGLQVVALLGRPTPLLAASNSPPSVRAPIRIERVRSAESAVAAMTAMGGEIPREVVDDPALAARAYPLIRDDLYLSQSFIDLTRATTIAGDIHVIAGADDTGVTRLEAWAAHTMGRCDVRRLPGRHLLAASNPAGLADAILAVVGEERGRTRGRAGS